MNAKEISSTECIAIFFRLLNASDDVNCRTVSVPSRQPPKRSTPDYLWATEYGPCSDPAFKIILILAQLDLTVHFANPSQSHSA